jgi:hypothetical protein
MTRGDRRRVGESAFGLEMPETGVSHEGTHLVKPPGRAATLLIEKHGVTPAHIRAMRELREARRARSRKRFAYWSAVIAEIDANSQTVPLPPSLQLDDTRDQNPLRVNFPKDNAAGSARTLLAPQRSQPAKRLPHLQA